MSEERKIPGMGWLHDYPDFRDYSAHNQTVSSRLKRLGQTDSVHTMLKKTGLEKTEEVKLPGKTDLREWCSMVENQGQIGSCTAQAGAALVEYFERRAFGRYVDVSRLFLYKVTRNLLHWEGDRGAYLRATMGAMTLFGAPPESYWPYVESQFDEEPTPFCYAFAANYQAISYYRLDTQDLDKQELLERIKANLAGGLPSMFGFTVYGSISQASSGGDIPFPTPGEEILGGHAVVAVGYDDGRTIRNQLSGEVETTGALLIRNSWGSSWGDQGYGWLPYEYVLQGLAVDWWSLLKNEWIDTGAFGL